MDGFEGVLEFIEGILDLFTVEDGDNFESSV